uniref:Uncharacterized protein LOC105037917 n=1 Tax=Elaeis guineensis var. tenera TaxID=51953 RepID=A0A6I9QPG6_ELAGV|nr:uncharacterized protein LOC105037917 [Elaeis guineensis]
MTKPRLAIITGAAGGIGEASVRLFAVHGAVIVIDIKDELVASIATSIGPNKCRYKYCDLHDEPFGRCEVTSDPTVTWSRIWLSKSEDAETSGSLPPATEEDVQEQDEDKGDDKEDLM